jgi:2-alkyl-3-oxoalkanoate reductase
VRLLVTGAGGFVGRNVVELAVARGHEVRALVRPGSAARLESEFPVGVEMHAHDLRDARGLVPLVAGVDTVVHLAAAKRGDLHDQLQHTVVATENLVRAIGETDVRASVLLGSFTVYDFARLRRGAQVDECTPLVGRPTERDAYTLTKTLQEEIFRAHSRRAQSDVTVLRAGAVWGPDEWWSARLGLRSGRWWVAIGGSARVPLTFVTNCALAVVLAAEQRSPGYRALNVVDDELPTQREHVRALRARLPAEPRLLRVPYAAALGFSKLVDATNQRFFDGRARVPNFFSPPALIGRSRPFEYSNRRLRDALGWEPVVSYADALGRTFDD